jgi:S1-C subfamily serine protease
MAIIARLCALFFLLGLGVKAQAALVEVVPQVKRSVVAIGTWLPTRSPAFQFRGTGFVVGDGRTIVTNYHVLPDRPLESDKMEVLAAVFPGEGTSRPGRPLVRVATEPLHDLALLRFNEGQPLPALPLGGPAQEGQSIAFTGFPIGAVLGMIPATHRGIIAAITPMAMPQSNSSDLSAKLVRRLANGPLHVYQLDATAYPGNSGGPLFDPETGKVLGILNMVFVKSTKESALSNPSGISYAIPVEFIKGMLEKEFPQK